MQEEAPGMVFWHPNGWTITKCLSNTYVKVQQDNGYLKLKRHRRRFYALGKIRSCNDYADNMFTTHFEAVTIC